MRIVWFSAVLLISACAGPAQIKPGERYVSPFGGFSCGPFQLDTKSDAHFGPQGGTIRLFDEVAMIRIDVQQFNPVLDGAMLSAAGESVYRGYLTDEIVRPLGLNIINYENSMVFCSPAYFCLCSSSAN